jgi:2-phosphosulfolactate phosphatase
MNVEVVTLPRDLKPGQLKGRTCVVFDVLRATTTMAAALAAGVTEIRLFADLESARKAADEFTGTKKLLCGESRCLMPDGFDLGNSPGQFREIHRGATMFMCTTNGTRALLAATEAAIVFPAALINASAIARTLRHAKRDVTLLCAGTDGEISMEDILGAGAVIDSLDAAPSNDAALIANQLFASVRGDLPRILRQCQGGKNILTAKLDEDIDFAARLNSVNVVGIASGTPPIVRLQSHE